MGVLQSSDGKVALSRPFLAATHLPYMREGGRESVRNESKQLQKRNEEGK